MQKKQSSSAAQNSLFCMSFDKYKKEYDFKKEENIEENSDGRGLGKDFLDMTPK